MTVTIVDERMVRIDRWWIWLRERYAVRVAAGRWVYDDTGRDVDGNGERTPVADAIRRAYARAR